MKYYIYVSDSKIDMLYQQIPQSLRSQVKTEVKLDLKLISTTFSEKNNEDIFSKFEKLRIVNEYLEKQIGISEIDNNPLGSYFKGSLSMGWGPLFPKGIGVTDITTGHDGRGNYALNLGKAEAVFFGGVSKKSIIGLVGSPYHLIGMMRDSRLDYDRSSLLPYILRVLQMEEKNHINEDFQWDSKGAPFREEDIYDCVAHGVERVRAWPIEKLEFVARKLLVGKPLDIKQTGRNFGAISKRVIIGSPIYVAMSE